MRICYLFARFGLVGSGLVMPAARLVVSGAVLLVLTGCGGSASPPSSPAGVASATPTTTPTPTVAAHPYTDPKQMVVRAKAAKLTWLHECSTGGSEYNLYGALYVSCFGRHGEGIYLETFDDPMVGDAVTAALPRVNPGSKIHVGNGWLVTTMDATSMRELVAALG